MTQHKYNLDSSCQRSAISGDLELTTYEEFASLVQSLGSQSTLDSVSSQDALSSSDLQAEPTMTYLDYSFGAAGGPFTYNDPVLPSTSSFYTSMFDGVQPSIPATTSGYEPRAVPDEAIPSSSAPPLHLPTLRNTQYGPSYNMPASGSFGLGSGISYYAPAQNLASPFHEQGGMGGYAPSTIAYTDPLMVGRLAEDLSIPVMASHQPHESSMPLQSGYSGGREWDLGNMIPMNASSSRTPAFNNVTHIYQQQRPPSVMPTGRSDDFSSNNESTNEDAQTTQPVVPNTHNHIPGDLEDIDDVPTVRRVPIPKEHEKASRDFPVIRFNVNRQPGVRVIDILYGMVTIDGAEERDFAQTGYRQCHLRISWPGYKDPQRSTTTKFSPTKYITVQETPKSKIYIKREELAKRICERIQWFIQKCSTIQCQPAQGDWTLNEHSPTRIRLCDIWLISIHRIEKGSMWIPTLEVRR